jgi:hypothetical protein
MARSAYIYLVRIKETDALLGCFTVKHEARTWADRWCGPTYPLERLQLSSMRDGFDDKKETVIPWEKA